jgi:RimJ/RimL family protein N-acetyltransferase
MVTPDDLRDNVQNVGDYHWEIHYNGARCKFNQSGDLGMVISDLKVPEEIQGQGIGTAMVRLSEQIAQEETSATTIYAQIGAPDDATRYIFEEKLGYEFLGYIENDTLGRVMDAMKELD